MGFPHTENLRVLGDDLMQISVSIKGMDGAKAMISGQSRQIPFATSLAINAVAKSIDDEQLGITLPDLDRTVGNRQGAYQDNHRGSS